jgi:hypothetical protein
MDAKFFQGLVTRQSLDVGTEFEKVVKYLKSRNQVDGSLVSQVARALCGTDEQTREQAQQEM